MLVNASLRPSDQITVTQATAARSFVELSRDPVPPLVALLKHGSSGVRDAAAYTLGLLGPRAQSALEALVEALYADNSWAAHALAETSAPAAMAALERAAWTGNQFAALALPRFGSAAVPGILRVVARLGPSHAEYQGMVRELRKFGHEVRTEALRLAATVLDERKPKAARYEALDLLVRLGPLARGAAAAMRPVLKSRDKRLQIHGRTFLLRSGNREAVGAFLRDWAANSRSTGRDLTTNIRMLESIGPAAAPAVPELIQVLERGAWSDRPAAARALGSIGAAKAVPALVAALSRNNWRLTINAAEALGRFGQDAASALPPLRAVASSHWMPIVRVTAADAILRIEPGHGPPPPVLLGSAEMPGYLWDVPYHDPCGSVAGWEVRLQGKWIFIGCGSSWRHESGYLTT
jgi:HEAT repeat protein